MDTVTHASGMDMGSELQKELDPLENAKLQFEEAAQRLKLDPSFVQIIKEYRRATIVKLPVQMDDGSSASSPDTGSSTRSSAGRPRAGSATTPT